MRRPLEEGPAVMLRGGALALFLLALLAAGFSGLVTARATIEPQILGVSDQPCSAIQYPSRLEDELGSLILGDHFNAMPVGFNSSLWDLSTFGKPSLAWDDGERFVLHTYMWQYSILRTKLMTGPEVVAEFNISFSGGLCYFGIGWSDRLWEPGSEWMTNLRLSDNGVFIDYWDSELYLVSYYNGERTAAQIPAIDVTQWHRFRLCWSGSLVRLEVDGVLCSFVSRDIPQGPLPFVITTSGHHYKVQRDQLRLEDLGLFSRERAPTVDDPQIVLLWPTNESTIYSSDLVDLQIDGSNGTLTYSWDDNPNSSSTSPWDIPVPNVPGNHFLKLSCKTETGTWRSRGYWVNVAQETLKFEVPVSEAAFVVDGAVEDPETGWAREYSATFRNEAHSEITLPVFVGFTLKALYVGLRSNLADRWNTRITLLVDGEGDGLWNTLSLSPLRDFAVCVGAPGADSRFELESPSTPSGVVFSRSLLPGLTYDSDISGGAVSAEFLIPLAAIGVNSSSVLGFGLKLSEGGQDWYFPASYSSTSLPHLPLVLPSLPHTNVPVPLWAATVLGVASLSLLGVRIRMRSRSLTDDQTGIHSISEKQERVLVLLESHPRLSMERLAELAGLDLSSTRQTLNELRELGIEDVRIEVSGNEVIRPLPQAGKTEKEESF